jgi:uncharacterized Fe-S cluster-containing radical SAM superfamily enzyme
MEALYLKFYLNKNYNTAGLLANIYITLSATAVMRFVFEDIKFVQEKDCVKGVFLKIFSFRLGFGELEKIGAFKVKDGALDISGSGALVSRKFNALLLKGFSALKNDLSGKKAVYVHKNSGIPLIGSVSFGIIDRNTSIIEVKPITSCNLDCVFCSVWEARRCVDFVVEADYIIDELKKLVEFKGCDDIEVHIGCQGEPLRYAKLCWLISEIKKLGVKRVSMDTNATMLTKNVVDGLIGAGLTRFNISLNSLDEGLAEKIAGACYNLKRVLEIIKYIAGRNVELVIAPVWVPKVNDFEIDKIIGFGVKLGKKQSAPLFGIQKYLKYKHGRSLKEMGWDEFFSGLREIEKKYKVKLVLNESDFSIKKTKELPKPFKNGVVVRAEILCPGRMKGEKIACAGGRMITVESEKSGIVDIRITRSKHNIFYGEVV